MKLPPNWIASSLGEICSQPQYGYTTKGSDNGTLRLLRTTDITSGNICWDSVPFCLENPADEDKYLLEDGDIVISRAGSVGVSYLLKNPERSVFASYLIRFKPYIDKQYFKYFLDSPYYWKEIADNKLGIAVPNVNASKLKEIAIPLPPENEQHRIVAKIEELFSELDKGIENLKTARAQLKVYRQALLKHAFDGKLTVQWREQNRDKLETAAALQQRIQQERAERYQQQLAAWQANGGSKPKAPKPLPPLTAAELVELPELPDGWGYIQIGNLLDVVSGNTPKGIETTKGTEIPYYRVSDMNRDGNEVSMNASATYLSENEAAEIGLTIYPVGTIIFPKRGGAIATNKKRRLARRSCFDLNLMGLTNLPDSLSAGYLWLWILSLDLASISDGSNVPQINNRNVEPLAFPICSFEEQALIVELAEARLSEVDQLELTITTSLQQAEALRQSILKKAFSGQLVPQDPHDEPASALLARIRAERATVAKSAIVRQRGRRG